MQVDLRPTAELSDDNHRELRELDERVHGPRETRPQSLKWAGIEDTLCAVRVREPAGRLVSVVYVNAREILVNGNRTSAGGIRGVKTDPAYRRQGYGRAAMQRAMGYIWQELQPEMGLLLSSQMAVPFYTSLGWQVFDGPVLCEQPGGVIDYTAYNPGHPPMVLVPGGAPLPTGTIDLCGLPW